MRRSQYEQMTLLGGDIGDIQISVRSPSHALGPLDASRIVRTEKADEWGSGGPASGGVGASCGRAGVIEAGRVQESRSDRRRGRGACWSIWA